MKGYKRRESVLYKKWDRIVLSLIMFLAAFIRFYGLNDRMDIFGDAGRDQLVARGAIALNRLPFIGSFSSAGPFVFGPLFYWMIIAVYAIFPSFIHLPQVVVTLLSLIPVIILFRIGYLISNKKFGLILSLFAAVSPAMIDRSTSFTHHSVVIIFASLYLWLYVEYLKNTPRERSRQTLYAIGMGLALGSAISLHYLSLNLLVLVIFLPIANYFSKNVGIRESIIHLAVLFLGSIIALFPLIFWDMRQSFANFRNLLDYLLIGQYRIWVPRRWLTFLGQFLPNFASSVVGGHIFIGFLLPILFGIFFLRQIKRAGFTTFRKSPVLTWLVVAMIIQAVSLRYYRGEIFLGYLVYLYPLVIVLLGWPVYVLLRFNRLLGGLLIVVVAAMSFGFSWQFISREIRTNKTHEVATTARYLSDKFPERSFKVYAYGLESEDQGYGLSLLLDQVKNKKPEMAVGFCKWECPARLPLIVQGNYNTPVEIVDLSGVDIKQENATLNSSERWRSIAPTDMYRNIVEWWKRKPLVSTFSLGAFIQDWIGF